MTDRSANNPRIGIFGGTFNPIHVCHLKVAAHCHEALGLGRIRFIPAGTPPLKATDLAPAHHRLEMVRRAIADDPRFEISDLEMLRDGPSYTADTLAALKKTEPTVDWTLILGLDTLLGMGAWHRPEAVLRQAPIAVLFRPGTEFADLERMPLLRGVDFSSRHGADPAPGGESPENNPPTFLNGDGIRLILLPIPPCSHSATQVRSHIRSGTMPVPGLSPEVALYIIKHHLYV